MLGYWAIPRRPPPPRGVPGFVGGDLAELDPDGYLWYHGRQDDILNYQGYRILAPEIERVMAGHPAVAGVAVGESRRAGGLALLTTYVLPPARRRCRKSCRRGPRSGRRHTNAQS
jgi:acyl-coenzyme A synthetase/AMP-(fatty) acid ligase